MTDHNVRRLRLFGSEQGISGSNESRNRCIEAFLGDMRSVFSEDYISALEDDVLGNLFIDWLSVAPDTPAAADRRQQLMAGWPAPIAPFTLGRKMLEEKEEQETPAPDGDKVVSLHERAGR